MNNPSQQLPAAFTAGTWGSFKVGKLIRMKTVSVKRMDCAGLLGRKIFTWKETAL